MGRKHFVMLCTKCATLAHLPPTQQPAGPFTVLHVPAGNLLLQQHASLGRSLGCPSLPPQATNHTDVEVLLGFSLLNYKLLTFFSISGLLSFLMAMCIYCNDPVLISSLTSEYFPIWPPNILPRSFIHLFNVL